MSFFSNWFGSRSMIESLQLRLTSFVDVRRSVRVSIISVWLIESFSRLDAMVIYVSWSLGSWGGKWETDWLGWTQFTCSPPVENVWSYVGYVWSWRLQLSSDRFMSYTSLNGITWGSFHSLVTSRADSSCILQRYSLRFGCTAAGEEVLAFTTPPS